MRKPDLSALGTGTAVLVLGLFLLLQANDTIDPDGGGVLAMLGGCTVVALIASSLGRRRAAEVEPTDAPTVVAPALSPEASRLSKAGIALGIVLAAGVAFLWANGSLELAGKIALLALGVATLVILVSAPFWVGMVRRLGSERVARARADERSEVAAHLHDSVLQTLALMQKRADDPEQVARLARRQERELREWLTDTEPSRPDERLADALRATAVEIEDSYGTPIEAVVVGDAPLDDRLEALVAASREALTNSAKFAAKGGPVRLYAEIEDGGARVFVDDRGPGFDPARIPNDRHGVRESIIGRMQRYGGEAEIHSEAGDGTEVELTMRAQR